jgi:heme/copper-type cytochrome/quinol oxidase subunit 4
VTRDLRRDATRTWLALVALTITSWLVAEHASAARLAATAVAVIAAIKVRFVFVHFMELPWRPLPWRLVFELWTVASATILIAGTWLAG